MIRYEDIEYEQLNNLNDANGRVTITETIPGISFGFMPSQNVKFFAGVHEGFAPPTVADSINGDGESVDTDPEHSTNYEVGFKSQPVDGVTFDGTYFRNEFDNLIASGSVAGNVPLAQGEALFEGAELLLRLDSDKLARTSFNLYTEVAWTWLWTAEQLTPFIRVEDGLPVGGEDTTGNRQPYAPEHAVTARIGYAEKGLFDVHLEAVYVGKQFADFLNLEDGSDHPDGPNSNNARSGQFGAIDEQLIFNFGATYTYQPTKTDIFLSIKNLFDEEYIVDRTRGILPGAPQLVHVGVKQAF
jgi:Fe(3+) dicitrate transport protein